MLGPGICWEKFAECARTLTEEVAMHLREAGALPAEAQPNVHCHEHR
jgi:hypothetical protein